jgi:DNA-binding transcriptional LysR family regulator
MDRLDAMRIFAAVARLGSFAQAARELRLSASVATRSVARLEDRLGLVLITRTTRSLRLTGRGEIYLESCRRILEDIDDAERRVRGGNAEPCGAMTVAAPIVFGRLHVLPIIGRMLDRHRGLTIRLRLSDRNIDLVDEGVDVAIRIGELGDSNLVAAKLGAINRVVVASPDYLNARGVPELPAQLVDHDIVAFESIDATNEWRFGAGEKPVRVEPRLTVNSADAAISAAEAGVGITRALSYQVKASVLAGRLIPVLRAYAPSQVPVSAVYPARRIASANVAVFMKTARSHFTANPVAPAEN